MVMINFEGVELMYVIFKVILASDLAKIRSIEMCALHDSAVGRAWNRYKMESFNVPTKRLS